TGRRRGGPAQPGGSGRASGRDLPRSGQRVSDRAPHRGRPGRRPGAGGGDRATEARVITLTGLTKRYGRFTAVDGIDLTVAKGELFGFLGPNGAGKTTTFRMIAGIILPTAGRIQIGG